MNSNYVLSLRSISALSADITPKWHHISTKSADINKLYVILAVLNKGEEL